MALAYGMLSYSVGAHSVLWTLCAPKHVISHEKCSDGCPVTEYRSIFSRPSTEYNREVKDRHLFDILYTPLTYFYLDDGINEEIAADKVLADHDQALHYLLDLAVGSGEKVIVKHSQESD